MRLIDADALLEQYDLKNATKYGNETAEQQVHSYDTLMMYEIADMIENAPTAYDVDKIEERLDNERYGAPDCGYEEGFNNMIDLAVEIIKSGTTATNGKNGG